MIPSAADPHTGRANNDPFLLLRIHARACDNLEYDLAKRRFERDRCALKLVERGHTWREVAQAAGFSNPYIAALKRKAKEAA